jgi:hypothetical protein
MSPLLQPLKLRSTGDGRYDQRAVIKNFFASVKEMVGNIHKWLRNVYGIAAVNSSIVGQWAKKSEVCRSRKNTAP